MITNIMSALFTIVLIALIFKLLKVALRLSWGVIKAIIIVAVMPCFLGGIFILGFWYIALPVAIALLVLIILGKIFA